MKKPAMILFDYGQTLMSEAGFDGEAGFSAVLNHASSNPLSLTGSKLYEEEKKFNEQLGRYNSKPMETNISEIHNHNFQRFLYEFFRIELPFSPDETETIFWNAASPAVVTEGIKELLCETRSQGIRTGVISNIPYSGKTLADRLHTFFPEHTFEFILASSDYVFRKPGKLLFELALRKAELPAQEVWYCGDHIRCDVEGASGAGIHPIWYTGALRNTQFYLGNTGKKELLPDCDCTRIRHWSELTTLLKSCF